MLQFKENSSTNALRCEMCRQPVTGFCKNLFATNMLATVQGKCVWCNATLRLDTAKDHVKQCQELVMPCSLCRVEVKRCEEEQHSIVCELIEVVCACGTRMKRREESQHRDTSCKIQEVPCPLKCGDTIKR